MRSDVFIQGLIDQTQDILHQVSNLKQMELSALVWKPQPEAWHILECLEHLNLYGAYYLPEIERKIHGSTQRPAPTFKSGILGRYFAKSILPKEHLNIMKAPADKNPIGSQLDKSTIGTFLDQQEKLLALLHQSKEVSLHKIKVKTALSSLINLKLGDTFQFYINHIIRHLAQIERVREALKGAGLD